MSCIEPDLEFKFVPNGGSEVFTELIVNLWSEGCITCNSLHFTLDAYDCKALLDYLEEVRRIGGGRVLNKNETISPTAYRSSEVIFSLLRFFLKLRQGNKKAYKEASNRGNTGAY